MSKPTAERQRERLTPQFQAVIDAFETGRASLSAETTEFDPELVLVFDLAGSVQDFHRAIAGIEGLEFLSELADEQAEPDDDFHMVKDGIRSDGLVQESLYLVMSNATAVTQLVSLFRQWERDPTASLPRGLGRFKNAFAQLRNIRRWGPEDRVRETGLLDQWAETLEVIGQSPSPTQVEIELWYRQRPEQRASAEAHVREVIERANGTVTSRVDIESIGYHAILADLPRQQVDTVLREGASGIELLTVDEVMFVGPYEQMSLTTADEEPRSTTNISPTERNENLPRIALLDGYPLANHDALAGRLTVDDPDDIEANYPTRLRRHGTAMASLIIHGDLSAGDEPLDRPLYVRPILEPDKFGNGEAAKSGVLLTDLLHRSIRRILEGEGTHPAAAPSVRVVNLSIGVPSRALVRRMSPVGRLLDWLSLKFNLLFIVSAGNHHDLPVSINSSDASSVENAQAAAIRHVRDSSKLRGVLPPGDAMNALTVGATHDDAAGDITLPDAAWDLLPQGAPSLYGAYGPGVGRSIKPDVFHAGGRALYRRPVPTGAELVNLGLITSGALPPGLQVAAPGSLGATNATAFSFGTSDATALVTREASLVFDVLESGAEQDDPAFPDALYHPLLVKALLVHSSTWGGQDQRLRDLLALDPNRARRDITAIFGYGAIRPDRIRAAATNRAVMVAGGYIGRDQRHTYEVPLPPSLRASTDWHRVTTTLCFLAPTAGQLTRYRSAKVFFEMLDQKVIGTSRIEADHESVRRGSVQHEIYDGTRAMVFGSGDSLSIDVQCMNDGQSLKKGDYLRYGLVISVETEITTSTTIHDEVRTVLRARARATARQQVQP